MACNPRTPTPSEIKYFERHILDKEIAELERKLQILRDRRNQLAPISSLPSELFVRIFNFVRQLQNDSSPYGWTVVTHISHHWRSIALGSCTLWNRIYYPDSNSREMQGHRFWALTSLQRSGSCKLDILPIRRYTHSSDFDLLSIILAQLHRIRTLRVVVSLGLSPASPNLQTLAGFFRNPAPALEEFSFGGNVFSSSQDEANTDDLDDFIWFNGYSPNLRFFLLNYPPIDLTGLPGQNLTHLELFDRFTEMPCVLFSTLLDLLSDAKGLQSLVLEYAFTLEQDIPLRTNRIFLESLKTSKLSLPPQHLLRFLAAVSVPSTSDTVIRVQHATGQRELILALTHYFQDGIRPASAIEYALQENNELALKVHSSGLTPNEKTRVHISLELPVDGQATFSGLDLLPISELQTILMTQNDTNLEFPDYPEVFGWCRDLEHINQFAIQGIFVDLFFDFVTENIEIFPKLDTLAVVPDTSILEDDVIRMLEDLHQILEQRAALVVPLKLQKVLLTNFEVSSTIGEVIQVFKGLVTGMEVSGIDLW